MPENIKLTIFGIKEVSYNFLFVFIVDSTNIMSYLSKRDSICLETFKTSRKLFFLPRDSVILYVTFQNIFLKQYGKTHMEAVIYKLL